MTARSSGQRDKEIHQRNGHNDTEHEGNTEGQSLTRDECTVIERTLGEPGSKKSVPQEAAKDEREEQPDSKVECRAQAEVCE